MARIAGQDAQDQNALESYVLAQGDAGRDRLRVLARVMEPGTRALFQHLEIGPGASCLDIGCGGGDVSRLLAAMVGPDGQVLGRDLDEVKLALAEKEAQAAGFANLSFRAGSVFDLNATADADLVYARFLLTHLSDPGAAIAAMMKPLKRGGLLVLEDIDFSGHFSHPPCPALWDYVRLYGAAVRAKGGDPDIGPRLPGLLLAAGLSSADLRIVQPAALVGEAKLISPITMKSVGPSVVDAGLASAEEVDRIVVALFQFAEDPTSVMSIPRIVQSWGRKP